MFKHNGAQHDMGRGSNLGAIFGDMTQRPSAPGPANTNELIRHVRSVMDGGMNPLLQKPMPVPVPKMPTDMVTADIFQPGGLGANLSNLLNGISTPQIPRSNSISDMLRRR